MNVYYCRQCANQDCAYSVKDIQEKGRVYIYYVLYPSVKLFSTIDGPAEFSKFGTSLAVGYPFGVNSDPMLAISAPSNGKLIKIAYRYCIS